MSKLNSGDLELETLPRTVTKDFHTPSIIASELSRLPSSPTSVTHSTTIQDPVEASIITKRHVKRARIQFGALCWSIFLSGWNDGSLGPLLPRIRETYNVGFTTVSLIFIFACVGFVVGALLTVPLNEKIGFGKILTLASVLQVIAYCIQVTAPPFPVFVLSYVVNGVGLSMINAQANTYVAALNDHVKMGILHAAYGAGALCSPLVATQFATMPRWSFHFLCSLGVAVSSLTTLTLVFRLKTQDECFNQIGLPSAPKSTSSQSTFRQMLRLPAVHVLAFFALVYVGTEVTIGGWIVTYIIETRQGGPHAGYISAGFFGGMMVGRVLLLWVNKKVGEWRVIYLYAALAIALELVVWLVPSLIGGGVAVSLVGVLLGPMYPIAMNHVARVGIPRWLAAGSIGWIAGFGQAGSALFPFATGALAGKFGISSLHPLLIAMMGSCVGLWTLVPRVSRKTD